MTDRTKEFVRVYQVLTNAPFVVKHTPLSQYSRTAQQISDGLKQNEQLVVELQKLYVWLRNQSNNRLKCVE